MRSAGSTLDPQHDSAATRSSDRRFTGKLTFPVRQLLQPGHHPVYQLYDRPDGASTFLPAFKIEGQQVSTTGEDPAKTIPLR